MLETTESEIKLIASVDAASRFEKSLLAGSIGKRERLVTTYFDTADWRLRDGRCVLRIREVAGKREQTFKQDPQGCSGRAIDRCETNCSLQGTHYDSSVFPPDIRDTIDYLAGSAELRPYATVVTERTSGLVPYGQAIIELAIDRVKITSREKEQSFCEIEAELKLGTCADLFSFVLGLRPGPELRWSMLNKSERGFLVATGQPRPVAKAGELRLRRKMPQDDAFRVIIWHCLAHLVRNYTLVVDDQNTEALHQCRVAMRRIRSALSLFRGRVGDELFAHIHKGFGDAARLLGIARDLDVLIAKVSQSAHGGGDAMAHDMLGLLLTARREQAYRDAVVMLKGERFQALLFMTALWMENGNWTRQTNTSSDDPNIMGFAARKLDRYRDHLAKFPRPLCDLDQETRHELRLKIKKLRYAVDFFASLYRGKRHSDVRDQWISDLAELSDCLGDLNDIATAHGAIDIAFSQSDPRSVAALNAFEDIQGQLKKTEPDLLVQADACFKRLLERERFWHNSKP